MFIRVWEYDVTPDNVDAFIVAYGPAGDWARLFQRGRGYVGTELFRGTDAPTHFVTLDRWEDQASWREFLRERGEDYEQLDARMNGLPASQSSLFEGSQ